jgi:tRNA G18 (ribose-2'-O)-methylase SpoU
LDSLYVLKNEGYHITALEVTSESIPLKAVSFQQKTCLVIGNEQNGVPDDILGIAESACHIEMIGNHVSSSNVAIASSIALYAITQSMMKFKHI